MNKLYCRSCKKDHNLDLYPDDGICVHCGNDLIESDQDTGISKALQSAVVDAVTDGMASAAISHGSVDKATN